MEKILGQALKKEREMRGPSLEAIAQETRIGIRHFAKGEGILAKTDKIDAFVIAEFARKSNLPVAFEASPAQIEFKQLIGRRIELKNSLQVEKCRMHLATGTILQSHENLIAAINMEVEKIDHLIDVLATQNHDIAQKTRVLCQQKGIGKSTAHAMMRNHLMQSSKST